jgi:hypothetical protein
MAGQWSKKPRPLKGDFNFVRCKNYAACVEALKDVDIRQKFADKASLAL